MKVSIFKTHLEKLENYLSSFEKKHKIIFFFAKLKSKLKNKILNINNVFKLREKILIIIIIQKNILNRNRAEGGFNNQSSFKNFNKFRKRKSQNDSNSDFKSFKKDSDIITRVFDNDIKRNVYTHNDRNNNMCVYCEKKDY